MSDKSFIDKVQDIQQRYVASKTENNDFGGYKYRNIEVMLTALKPLLKEHDLLITFSDEVQNFNERYYVKTTATITDGKDSLSASAYAREELEKKKSDASQLTGSASTYARKYALSGLLGVDDGSNDPDSKDNDRKHYKSSAKPVGIKFATEKQIDWIRKTAERISGYEHADDIDKWVKEILTIEPKHIPIGKVKDAVDKLEEVGKLEREEIAKNIDPDIEITDDDIKAIENGELPY